MALKILAWVLVIIVIAGAASGYYYYRTVYAAAPVATETPVQTATVRRGSLVISATGTGTIIAAKELGVGFDESGVLLELNVAVGDKVKQGDVLARLQTKNTEESIALAVSDAELSVVKYQQALDDLLNADMTLDLAKAKMAVIDAQTTLTDVTAERERMNYQRCLDSAIESYEAQYLSALNAYQQIKERYNENYAPLSDNDPERLNALASLYAAEERVQTALINYNWCKGTASESEIAEADANVALADAQLKAAETEVARLENYPDPDDVALAQVQLDNAQAKLAEAKEAESIIELTAPFDGTILDISAIVGESIGTGAIINLADLSQPTLEVYLDETDLNSVGVGYEIEVIFDALPDQTFPGTIVSVDPSLTSMQNVTAVRAIAQLDTISFAKPQNLPIGLNASVEIIGSKAENALLVPVEALRELSAGKYGVFVMENGQPKLHVVEVGLMDYTYAEIISGLDEGDVVTTGIVETSQ